MATPQQFRICGEAKTGTQLVLHLLQPAYTLYHELLISCFLGKNSSDQRERVLVMVRQHRLISGPAALCSRFSFPKPARNPLR